MPLYKSIDFSSWSSSVGSLTSYFGSVIEFLVNCLDCSTSFRQMIFIYSVFDCKQIQIHFNWERRRERGREMNSMKMVLWMGKSNWTSSFALILRCLIWNKLIEHAQRLSHCHHISINTHMHTIVLPSLALSVAHHDKWRTSNQNQIKSSASYIAKWSFSRS